MSTAIQRGFVNPFLQRQTGRYSPVTGWSFDQEFRGLSAGQMQALAYQYAGAGCEYEITIQPGMATLRTVDNRGNITIDTWELGPNKQIVSSLKNPKNIFEISANDMVVIARAYLDQSNFDIAIAALAADGKGAFTMPDVTDSSPTQRLYDRLKNNGESGFYYDQYVLRHTTNASNRGYFNVADRNVNCIYTQSQFYSEIRSANFWLFPAPLEIIGALDQIFLDLSAPPDFYLKGALKGASQRVTAANNRINIVTEYNLFNWSTDEYYLAS